MSDGVLNPDQIAALVEAAKQGKLPEAAPPPPRRQSRLRTVDFSRPTKFSGDHQRRINRAIDTFCQTSATRLSAELRWPVEIEAINTQQVTWSAATHALPHGSLAVTLDVPEISTRMLLTLEQTFVLAAIEALLGGSADRLPRERRLSEIDWSLARRVIASLVHQLSLVFHDLGGVSLQIAEIEQHQDASQVASVSEPTLVIHFDCKINRLSTALVLLIPWVAIDPVADTIAGREHDDAIDGTGMTSGMARALSVAPVTLRAEVAATSLPVQEILALAPGSLIRLGTRAEQGITVFAENVRLARAQPGAAGARRAVQLRALEIDG